MCIIGDGKECTEKKGWGAELGERGWGRYVQEVRLEWPHRVQESPEGSQPRSQHRGPGREEASVLQGQQAAQQASWEGPRKKGSTWSLACEDWPACNAGTRSRLRQAQRLGGVAEEPGGSRSLDNLIPLGSLLPTWGPRA